MCTLTHHPYSTRQSRTRTLVQLGGLLEKVGLNEHFGIVLGTDLQKDLEVKEAMSTLVGALLELKKLLETEVLSPTLLQEKGLRYLAQQKQEKRKKQDERE